MKTVLTATGFAFLLGEEHGGLGLYTLLQEATTEQAAKKLPGTAEIWAAVNRIAPAKVTANGATRAAMATVDDKLFRVAGFGRPMFGQVQGGGGGEDDQEEEAPGSPGPAALDVGGVVDFIAGAEDLEDDDLKKIYAALCSRSPAVCQAASSGGLTHTAAVRNYTVEALRVAVRAQPQPDASIVRNLTYQDTFDLRQGRRRDGGAYSSKKKDPDSGFWLEVAGGGWVQETVAGEVTVHRGVRVLYAFSPSARWYGRPVLASAFSRVLAECRVLSETPPAAGALSASTTRLSASTARRSASSTRRRSPSISPCNADVAVCCCAPYIPATPVAPAITSGPGAPSHAPYAPSAPAPSSTFNTFTAGAVATLVATRAFTSREVPASSAGCVASRRPRTSASQLSSSASSPAPTATHTAVPAPGSRGATAARTLCAAPARTPAESLGGARACSPPSTASMQPCMNGSAQAAVSGRTTNPGISRAPDLTGAESLSSSHCQKAGTVRAPAHRQSASHRVVG